MNRQRVMAGTDRRQGCRSIAGYQGQFADPLQMLKGQLLAGHLAEVRDSDLEARLRRAADESASIAWATSYPLLAFPELLREKTAQALLQHERQRKIRSGGRGTVSLAA